MKKCLMSDFLMSDVFQNDRIIICRYHTRKSDIDTSAINKDIICKAYNGACNYDKEKYSYKGIAF